ncbi:MAG: 3-hydroxyacyl-CoA dehydrogenase [Thermodesulfobacteriota bacterium]|nr:3-hydroxyacyl-CoA dehydrogenase [Thermodesulfobacteriota bacterium]
MKVDDIKQVLIIGAGTMGQQIGFLCALKGYQTVIYDISDDVLNSAAPRLEKLARQFVSHDRATATQADAALAGIAMTSNVKKAGEKADFVSESVIEDLDTKCQVLETFNDICPAHAIFTTNTSSLIPSMMAFATGRPEKFAAFHFHNTLTTKIVDIMPHPDTAAETVALIEAFALKLGQVPIKLEKENHGYAFNALLMNLCDTALNLAASGVTTIEDIDRAWMGIMHMNIGPFGIMDSVGLDTTLDINELWANQLNDPKAIANVAFLKTYVENGKLGIKSGEGFYKYPHPAYKDPDFID